MTRVRWYERLDSTMTEAARLVREGEASGIVVAAREQTAGQGRQGRQWLSGAGEGLYATFVYRVRAGAQDVPCLTLAFGLAAAEAMTAVCRESFDIRWPNDVLWRGRKCCGILARLEEEAVLVGVGINLRQREFPEELRTPAVSLWQASGRELSAEEMLEALLPAMDGHVRLYEERGREAVIRLFMQASSYAVGRRVIVDLDGRTLTGVTAGLDEHGFLLVDKEDGTRETVLAGGVRPWE